MSVLGLAAAIGSFRSGWKATALPPPHPEEPAEDEVSAVSDEPQVSNADTPQ